MTDLNARWYDNYYEISYLIKNIGVFSDNEKNDIYRQIQELIFEKNDEKILRNFEANLLLDKKRRDFDEDQFFA